MYTAAMPASSSHAAGVPGSEDRHAYAYAALMFFSGFVHTWATANNIAIMAEVRTADICWIVAPRILHVARQAAG